MLLNKHIAVLYSFLVYLISFGLGIPEKEEESLIEDVKIQDDHQDDSPHILPHFPWNTKSHRILQNTLLLGLLDSGYTVTGVFPQSSDIKHSKYTEIVVSDTFSDMMDLFWKKMMAGKGTNPFLGLLMWPEIIGVFTEALEKSDKENERVFDILDKQGVNISAVVYTLPMAYISAKVGDKYPKASLIGMSPPGRALHFSKYMGTPENPSYIPELAAPAIDPMYFSERLINTIIYAVSEPWIWKILPNPIDIYGTMSLLEKTSIMLQNSHEVTHGAQVLSPNVINVGGLHCKEAKPLPTHFQTFLDEASKGAIYVSFGSTLKPSQMTEERKEWFISVFRRLSVYRIIWKWDEDSIEDLPSNVLLTKWAPQQDILGHPNIKVFVTHGGLLSLHETIYHKTPLVVFLLEMTKPQTCSEHKRMDMARC